MSEKTLSTLETLSRVLVAPLVSEKTSRCGDKENSVVFWVNPTATKTEIKEAVEAFFPKVKVAEVRTLIQGAQRVRFGQREGKRKKRKKAYVTLAEGSQINFAEFE